MEYSTETIEQLKREGRFDARLLGVRGALADLSRRDVIVHAGKPMGAVSGWVGPVFWQVWTEPGDVKGRVYARVDRAGKQAWQLDAALQKEALLDAAKDKAIGAARAVADQRQAAAQAELDALERTVH